jgi:cleavage stimulation factor subunit 1
VVANETSTALNPNLPSSHLAALVKQALTSDATATSNGGGGAGAGAAAAAAHASGSAYDESYSTTIHKPVKIAPIKLTDDKDDDDIGGGYDDDNMLSKGGGDDNGDGDGALADDSPVREFPDYLTRYVATHEKECTAAAFSKDGLSAATASTDASIKVLEVSKMHYFSQLMESGSQEEGSFASVRPVVKTLYAHTAEVNALDFHPTESFLASAGDDATIHFWDYSAPHKRSYKHVTDTHAVSSIHFHPTGDFLLGK